MTFHLPSTGEMATDRRSFRDRRSHNRPRLKFLLFGSQRKSARRDQDKKTFIYVDQYHPWLQVAFLILVVLSICDALFTLHLIERGAYEKNPVMVYFLGLGVGPFMVAKLVLTCSTVLVFLIFHNYYFSLLHIHAMDPDVWTARWVG
jgi:hypothetical protein